MDSPTRILIGHADALSAPEFVWSLADAGYETHAFVRRGSHAAIRRSRCAVVHEITPAEEDSFAAAEDVIRLANHLDVAALAPLDDESVWLCDRAADYVNAKVVGPTGQVAAFTLDKSMQIAAANDAGLLAPNTRAINKVRDFDDSPMLPCILKPAHAVSEENGRLVKHGGTLCANLQELEVARDRWGGRWSLLAQPLVRGNGEGIFGLMTERGVVAWSAHRRVRMMNPHGSGSSACAAMTPDPALLAPIDRFLKSVHWDGIFMIELLRDTDGRAWFMELNGRSWGSMALARRQGFEYPAWSIRHALEPGAELATPTTNDGLVCRHLGRELLHLAYVWRGPKSKAVRDWPGRLAAMRAVLSFKKKDCWYNARRGETKTFIADLLITLRGALPQRKTRNDR